MNYLKGILILIVLAGIIGGIGYVWQENQITEEQKAINNEIELNLSFFTSDFPLSQSARKTESITEWSSVYNDLATQNRYKANYQKGFNKNGQVYFRIVQRNANPPALTFYWMDNDAEENEIRTTSIFIIECLPGKKIDYVTKDNKDDDRKGSLTCSKDGQYLYSTFSHTYGSDEINKDTDYSINANGFLLKFNMKLSMVNELRRNKSLLKLN